MSKRTVGNNAPDDGALWIPVIACDRRPWTGMEYFEKGNDYTRAALWGFILAAVSRMD